MGYERIEVTSINDTYRRYVACAKTINQIEQQVMTATRRCLQRGDFNSSVNPQPIDQTALILREAKIGTMLLIALVGSLLLAAWQWSGLL